MFLNPPHLARVSITRLSESGMSVSLTNIILKIIKELEEIYIYSPSLPQDLQQKLVNCFSNFIPLIIIQNVLSEEDLGLKIEGIVNHENFEKSQTEIEAFQTIEE